MAKSEACEVFLEQEIKEGLEQEKNPHQIGKDLAKWLQDNMDVHISPNAVCLRAFRIKRGFSHEKSEQTQEVTIDDLPKALR